jgi:hypothetical protein
MALLQLIDSTNDYNANGSVNLDIGGWDYVVVQIVSPTGTTLFKTSNDSGSVLGVTEGNALTATNFLTCLATNLANDARVSSVSADGLFKINVAGRFLQIIGSTVGKLLVTLQKIDAS